MLPRGAWRLLDLSALLSKHATGGYTRLGTELLDDDPEGLVLSSEKRAGHRRWVVAGIIARFPWFLLPSFVSRRLGHGDPDVAIPRPDATSYLNGLRGLAATIVVVQHMTNPSYPFIEWAYGAREEDKHVVQLPFVRVLVSGRFMVSIFFVLSGFVLAYGPLRKAHRNERATGGLVAAVCRRPVRLFLPVLPVALITPIFVWMGVFYEANGTGDLRPSSGTLLGDLAEGWREWWHMAWLPGYGIDFPGFFPHVWTLNAELYGSLVVFLLTLVLSRVPVWARLLCVSITALEWLHGTRPQLWPIFCFTCGFLLADLRHLRAALPNPPRTVGIMAQAASWLLLVPALFLGGWPTFGAADGLGYRSWARVPTHGTAPHFYWHSVGAALLVAALEGLPPLQRLLNRPLLLYLGDISFGLYLAHWAVLCTVGGGVQSGLRARGVGGPAASLAACLVAGGVAVWAGDLHWRLVDRKVVRFSRWAAKALGVS